MSEGSWRVDSRDERYLRYFENGRPTRRRVLRSAVDISPNPEVDPRLADVRSTAKGRIINSANEHGF